MKLLGEAELHGGLLFECQSVDYLPALLPRLAWLLELLLLLRLKLLILLMLSLPILTTSSLVSSGCSTRLLLRLEELGLASTGLKDPDRLLKPPDLESAGLVQLPERLLRLDPGVGVGLVSAGLAQLPERHFRFPAIEPTQPEGMGPKLLFALPPSKAPECDFCLLRVPPFCLLLFSAVLATSVAMPALCDLDVDNPLACAQPSSTTVIVRPATSVPFIHMMASSRASLSANSTYPNPCSLSVRRSRFTSAPMAPKGAKKSSSCELSTAEPRFDTKHLNCFPSIREPA